MTTNRTRRRGRRRWTDTESCWTRRTGRCARLRCRGRGSSSSLWLPPRPPLLLCQQLVVARYSAAPALLLALLPLQPPILVFFQGGFCFKPWGRCLATSRSHSAQRDTALRVYWRFRPWHPQPQLDLHAQLSAALLYWQLAKLSNEAKRRLARQASTPGRSLPQRQVCVQDGCLTAEGAET
jgi:hypothetical protein